MTSRRGVNMTLWRRAYRRGSRPPHRGTGLSDVRVLRVMGVSDGGAQALVELGRVQDDLLAVHGGNRAERHDVLAGILDVDHQLGAPVWSDPTDRTEGLARLGCENLVSLPDRLLR